MDCPKCDFPLEPVTFHGITVDRCVRCKGIWFNGVAHKELKKIAGSGSIDSGSASIGRMLDQMPNVSCPVCKETMNRIHDTFQPHMHYEACPAFHGVFFDAGEFRDYKEEGLSDFFKDLAWYFKKNP